MPKVITLKPYAKTVTFAVAEEFLEPSNEVSRVILRIYAEAEARRLEEDMLEGQAHVGIRQHRNEMQ